ncbi:hypothetical protein ACWCXH_16085 [Kitasatospora sp. NPDC001660]
MAEGQLGDAGGKAGVDLRAFDVDPVLGFLPGAAPLTSLPAPFDAWDETAAALPKHLVSGRARTLLADLPRLDVADLPDGPQLERAMLLLSHFGHAWINDSGTPAAFCPAPIAVPWHAVAERLGRPPVLSYATQQLHNWARLDPDGPVELGNIRRLQDFLGGMDDDWFVLVHVAIEAAAGPGINAAVAAQDAASAGDAELLADRLHAVAAALQAMHAVLARMPERCDPYIYYHRVRRFLFGWKDNPALPDGLVYQGVAAFAGRPQRFSGETGAQSSVVPFLDAVLGIADEDDPLRNHLHGMRDYMPPRHREFIASVGGRLDLRGFLTAGRPAAPLAAYNACIEAMAEFRALHLRFAAEYVQRQARREEADSADTGTGGTPFMRYLGRHLDSVRRHAID